MFRFSLLAVACAALLTLSACGEKKSLDGYSMEKPPPSAFMERDSAPDMSQPVAEEAPAAEKQD